MKKYDIGELYAFDYETELMGSGNLAPPPICFSVAHREQGAFLISDGDDSFKSYVRGLIDHAYENENVTLVAHNAKYDMHVFCKDNPDMYHKVCVLYRRGQIIDTMIIEKLLNLTTTGRISSEPPRNSDDEEARGKQITYSLADLVLKYLGKDITMDKTAEDAVRLRYAELKGTPSAYYPKEFKDYSLEDSIEVLEIVIMQLENRDFIIESQGFDPLCTLTHRCTLDFHLYRMTMEGVRTDPDEIHKLEEMLEEELAYEKLDLLYPEYVLEGDDWDDLEKVEIYIKRDREKAVLKPSAPVRPAFLWSHRKDCPKIKDEYGIFTCDERCFRRESKSHVEDCKKKQDKFTRQWLCDCPTKMNQAEKNKTIGSGKEKEFVHDEDGNKIPIQVDMLNNAVLKGHIFNLWKADPEYYDLMFSDSAYDKKGQNFLDADMNLYWNEYKLNGTYFEEACNAVENNLGLISTKAEWLDIYAHRDPILKQFAHRASLIKLQTTEIPRMKDRETDEISEIVHGNFDVLKETGRTSGYASKLYASANLQNLHKMARKCYRARKGHWILSTDYSSLEFVSAAQMAYTKLGRSVYKTIFDNGWDAHGYLAAQRAYRSEPWFAKECKESGIVYTDHEGIYHQYHKYKGSANLVSIKGTDKPFHKHYRNSAKPIGLGLLGGMGSATIARVSSASYGLDLTIPEADEYKGIWYEIFEPEAELIKMINRDHKDPMFSTKNKKKFKYVTPMGMVRPNCSFAACSNGNILQSPSAEGATLAVIAVMEACYDPESTSILKGNFFPWAFVHDEILGDVVADPEIATAVARELERIMCQELNTICPDVTVSADSALMINLDKGAEDLYNRDGLLVPWECKFDEKLAKEVNYAS